MSDHRVARLIQRNSARTDIFALVDGADGPLGYGPLGMDQIHLRRFAEPELDPWARPGDPALGARLTASMADFHPLDDFFRFYQFPADLIEWVEATPLRDAEPAYGWYHGGGRDCAEVAARLDLDEDRLRRAAVDEAIMPGLLDPAGDARYHTSFTSNWAVADATGWVRINPNSYRFKAWLSLDGRS